MGAFGLSQACKENNLERPGSTGAAITSVGHDARQLGKKAIASQGHQARA